MDNIIDRAHILSKQNRQQPGITNGPSNTTPNYLNSHNKFIVNVDAASK